VQLTTHLRPAHPSKNEREARQGQHVHSVCALCLHSVAAASLRPVCRSLRAHSLIHAASVVVRGGRADGVGERGKLVHKCALRVSKPHGRQAKHDDSCMGRGNGEGQKVT